MNLLKARYFNLYEVCTAYHYQHYLIISYKYKWKRRKEFKKNRKLSLFFFYGLCVIHNQHGLKSSYLYSSYINYLYTIAKYASLQFSEYI